MKIIILLGVLTAVLGYNYDDASIKADFVAFNTNHDGYISLEEMFANFLTVDVNGNCKLTLREFTDGLRPGNYSVDITRAAYNFYDRLDGRIHGVLDPFTVLHTFNLMDHDNNQKVTWEEWIKFAREVIQISTHDAGFKA